FKAAAAAMQKAKHALLIHPDSRQTATCRSSAMLLEANRLTVRRSRRPASPCDFSCTAALPLLGLLRLECGAPPAQDARDISTEARPASHAALPGKAQAWHKPQHVLCLSH